MVHSACHIVKMSDQKDPISVEHEEHDTKEAGAASNVEGEDAVIDKRAERRFLLKADLRIMTTISCVYFLSSLVSPDTVKFWLSLTVTGP